MLTTVTCVDGHGRVGGGMSKEVPSYGGVGAEFRLGDPNGVRCHCGVSKSSSRKSSDIDSLLNCLALPPSVLDNEISHLTF